MMGRVELRGRGGDRVRKSPAVSSFVDIKTLSHKNAVPGLSNVMVKPVAASANSSRADAVRVWDISCSRRPEFCG